MASLKSYFYPVKYFFKPIFFYNILFYNDPEFALVVTLFLGNISLWSPISKYSILGSLLGYFLNPGEFVYLSLFILYFFTLPASDLIFLYFILYSNLSSCFFISVWIFPYTWICLLSAILNIYFTFLISTWPWLK